MQNTECWKFTWKVYFFWKRWLCLGWSTFLVSQNKFGDIITSPVIIFGEKTPLFCGIYTCFEAGLDKNLVQLPRPHHSGPTRHHSLGEENQQCCWNALEANSCKWIWTKKNPGLLTKYAFFRVVTGTRKRKTTATTISKMTQQNLYNCTMPLLILTILIHPPVLYLLVTERWAKSKAINKVWHLKSLRVEHVYLGRSGNNKEQQKTIKQLPVNRCKCKSCDLFVWNMYICVCGYCSCHNALRDLEWGESSRLLWQHWKISLEMLTFGQ